MKPVLIFDYDGTIHNTIKLYEPAFRRGYEWLIEEGCARREELSAERIAGWLGLNKYEMWHSFQPQLSDELVNQVSDRIGNDMARQIKAHQGVWYQGAQELLDRLKAQGYSMVILSNCKISYREINWDSFHLERWFQRFYDCESFGFAPKTQIIHQVKRDFPGPALMIGDRRGDLDCARAGKIPFIGCAYGYGAKWELKGADYIAHSPDEIENGIKMLTK